MSTHRSPNQQLTLLEPVGVPAPLQLDERTRRIGLAGVAEARAILAESRRRRLEREAEAAEARRPGRAA
jgi:hypothetical protein